ncbi:IPT/TIG domain-containing protein [Dyella flava]|uniref:IPT/TIG domain-containing protein n=1 Tax=Dyella flava TaxID=1920170 RepID=UPI0024E19420|nr:IPT/TIG domain-containing protein [Dyella flava]
MKQRGGLSLVTWTLWLLCSALLWAGTVQAQSTSYVYDANGRVVAVTSANGTSVQYGYDTLGHTSQVSAPLAPGQMAIFAFMPTHGEAGTQVTIQGQGFDSNVANDTVSFNGTVATVLSATATQLVTTVPSGATTGPISVTADGQTATSATPFVIDDTGVPPSITQVSPTVASVGSTVTVTGTNLNPVSGNTTLQMNGMGMVLASVAETQLQYTVPSNASSGYMTVETPYGTATSATPEIVLPTGVSASSVVSTANATVNGASINLNIGASGQIGAMTFIAPQSGWVSLQASAITTTAGSISYTVYGPGNAVVQQGSISTSSPSIHLPHLVAGSTYLALFTPSGAGAQLTMGVQTNAWLTSSVQATVATSVAGASQRVLFQATAGQNLAFLINSTSTNPSGHSVTYTVYSPSGASYTSTSTASTGVINFGSLATGGTYQVIVAPGSGVTGTMQVEIEPGVGGALSATSQSYTTNMSGQNAYLTFTAKQGENLELTLNNVSVTGSSSNQLNVYVYNAAGSQIASFSCAGSNPGGSCMQHLWYMAAGTYTVVAAPNSGGTISFNALLQDDLIGPAVATGGTANISLGAGQVERLTFNANVGETVALNVSGITTTPPGQTVTFTVYSPSVGQAITTNTSSYTSFSPSGSEVVNLSNLPVSGTYTVIVSPNYGLPATAQFSVVPGDTGTLVSNSASQSYAANVSGQNAYLNFTATQGENLELTLNNISVAGGSSDQFYVYIYNQTGNQIAGYSCSGTSPGASCIQHLWYLAAGTYTVVATPNYGGAINFNALLQDDLIGPAVATGGTANISLGAGQVERLTFNANVGETVALNVSGITTTPSGQAVAFTVYSPTAGQAITTNTSSYTSFSPSGSEVVNLSNLPVSGTYTVIVSPNYGLPATAQFSVVPGDTGTLVSNSASQSYAANVSGQNAYLNFTATQGENLELTLNNISVAGGSSDQFYVYIYNQTGNQIAGYSCSGTSPGASCIQHLWYLAAGTYTVVATPNYGGAINFNALLQDDLIGPAVATGGTANISLGAGQVERLTFNANVGETVALNVSGITTTPPGQAVTFTVYSPSVGQAITTNTSSYTSFSPSGSEVVNLSNLPVSGTYTVIVSPNYGLPATAQFSVVPGDTGTLVSNSASQSYAVNVSGQNVYMTFTATQNENLELAFNNVNVTGGSSNQFYVNVYNQAGSQIAGFSCSGTSPGASCIQHLWYLAAGTYTVVATPNYGGAINFNALLQDDLIGPAVATGSTANISLGAGQVDRLTFNANVGDTVVLDVSGVTTTPSGQPVTFTVYSPGVGQAITTNTSSFASLSPSSSQTVNLSNLPATGTYTVTVSPNYGLPAAAQFSVVSDTAGAAPTYGTPTLAVGGATQGESSVSAGQSVTMTFNATQGDNLEVGFSNVSVTGGSEFLYNIYNSGGANISGEQGCFAGSNCRFSLWNLAAGTYTVVASPVGSTGPISFSAQVQPDTIGPALTVNTPVAVNLGVGQVERYTFTANAGDTYALQLSGVTNGPVYANVYRPDTGAITTGNYYTTFNTGSSQTINLTSLPVSGTYTVVIYTGGVAWGTPATAQLTLASGVTGTLTSGGAIQNYASSVSGQSVYVSFNANQGDNLEVSFSNVSVTGGSEFLYNIYNSGGANISGEQGCFAGSNCRFSLWNLAAGTYTVVASPVGSTGPISFSAQVQPDTIGPALTVNTPVAVNLGVGQVERYTFTANAGDTYALQLSGVTSGPVYANVYRPDTGAITTGNYYTTFNTGSSQTINLTSLPVSGTYTVVIYTGGVAWGTPATAQLTLAPGVTGTLTSGGAIQNYASPVSGQSVYVSFNANQGDNLEVSFSNVSVTGGSEFLYNIYNSGGANISGEQGCFAGSNCRFSLWNLAAGTYTVVASPVGSTGPISFSAQVQPDTIGPALTVNTPVAVNLGVGQVERYTFTANAGDTYALQLSGVTSGPVYANVYRPDTGAITTGNYYTTFNTSSSQAINLTNLPVSGTYTVVVYSGGAAASAQLMLTSGAAGTLNSGGAIENFAGTVGNQDAYVTFNANQGDNLEFNFSNVSVTNGSEFEINIYNASGVNISGLQPCFSSDCRFALWNMPAGTYTVVVSPSGSTGVVSFSAQIQPDIIGPALTANTPVTVNLGAGQVERYTFTANAGDTYALQLSGVTGGPVYANVYRPDTGAITTGNYYTTFNTSSSQTISLTNLPASGTYTVVVYTAGPAAAAQLALLPNTTGTLSTTGSIGNFAASGAGDEVPMTFYAAAGSNLELTLSNVNASGASTNGFEVFVTDPNGSQVANFYCYASSPGSSCAQPLWNLIAGTYSISAVPVFGGTISFSAQLSPDLVGPALSAGTAANISLAAGQAERVTFNANQGGNIVLQLAGVSTTPANQNLYVDVYEPDVGEITTADAYGSFETSGSNSLSLTNLPVSGTYTAVIRTGTGIPASAQLSYATQ